MESGWQEVGDLSVGEHIRKADGTYGTVTKIEVNHLPQWMYNLTVDQAHTFYVGDQEWLVHNACLESNALGQWGAEQVANELPVDIGRYPVRNSSGALRIYDGQFNHSPGHFVEIKTSAKSAISIDSRIRAEINFDAGMLQKPHWIFVNVKPSRGLMAALRLAEIPWSQLHVPWP